MPMKTIVTLLIFCLSTGGLFSQSSSSLVREFDYQVSGGKADRNHIVYEKQYRLKDMDNRQKVSDICRILAACQGVRADINHAELSLDTLGRIAGIGLDAPDGKSYRIEMEYNSRNEIVRAVVFPTIPAEQAVEYQIEYLYPYGYNYSSKEGKKFIAGVHRDSPWVLRSVKRQEQLVRLTERKITNK